MNILQQNKFKTFIITAIIQAMVLMPVFAIDLDYTVDDEIRKNYNVTPISPTSKPVPAKKTTSAPVKTNSSRVQKPVQAKKTITKRRTTVTLPKNKLPLRKGMQFDLVNVSAISDRQRKGTNIVFATTRPIKTAYYTIPEGTRFIGKITESHTPQITGNGGLVSIEIMNIVLSGQYQHIDSRIIKVNGKRIFFEDIKSKRSFWANTKQKGKWGRNTCKKMNRISKDLAKDKTTVILSPFTFVYGATLGVVSTATSPVVSFFCKGKNLYLPPNTKFRIKLEKDVNVYY